MMTEYKMMMRIVRSRVVRADTARLELGKGGAVECSSHIIRVLKCDSESVKNKV